MRLLGQGNLEAQAAGGVRRHQGGSNTIGGGLPFPERPLIGMPA